MIWASLVPRSEVETIGSTTPMSTRSMSPKLMKKDVIVMSISSARRSAITSFSWVGTPYGVHEAPTMLSHCRPDERNERAVVVHRCRDEMVGVQGGRRVGPGGAAQEQRVLAVREDEQLGDLIPEALRLQ